MDMSKRAEELMSDPRRGLFKLAIPIMVGMLAHTLFNIVDTIFVGRLGAEAIASVTIAFPIAFIIIAIGSGVGIGTTSLVARLIGAKRKRMVDSAAENAIILSIILSIIITVAGIVTSRPLFVLMGVTGNVLEMSVSYINIIFSGMIFMLPMMILASILRGEGNAKTPMKIMITTSILNAVFDPVFIYLLGYGVPGAAMASVLARLIGSLVMFHIFFIKRSTYVELSFRKFRMNWNIIKDIFSVGIPASLSQMSMSAGLLILNVFLIALGSVYVAAFGLGFRVDMLILLPIFGISSGLITMVGMYVGARNFERAKWITKYAMKISVVIMGLVGLLFFLIAEYLMMIFTNDPQVIMSGAEYIRIVVLSYPFAAIGITVYSSFQGAGKGIPALVLTLLRVILLSVPIAYALTFVYGFGATGVWIAVSSASIISAVVGLIWYKCFHFEKCKITKPKFPINSAH
ncbi:MAG: MATE family efflux transporter [Candidatus Aenigmarchaeota archaeon]|nr:MATE family efflux transporter [Candidatus Aenigmarchaeota archaeon]NIP40657.1 MATE family efflux transporter [Candidatus Aenigmarchaeota archaeon]NIQ18463.1 MATE family efflux transporter [Candidatus Aenigmarchaeota archaeon]NIS73362.1 MATE family efflux transporter [Candidatus Aenigmarchaeota archaeon]